MHHSLKIALSALISAVVLGASSLVVGFIGPILFTPEANQGPLLGIFITGPVGFILGGLVGGTAAAIKQQEAKGDTDGRARLLPKLWQRFLIGMVVLSTALIAVNLVQSP